MERRRSDVSVVFVSQIHIKNGPLIEYLVAKGISVDVTQDPVAARAIIDARQATGRGLDAIIIDLSATDEDGCAFISAAHRRGEDRPVVIALGDGSLGLAVQAMRSGAVDFLVKPVKPMRLLQAIDGALAGRAQPSPRRAAKSERAGRQLSIGDATMIGRSAPMQSLYAKLARVAPSQATTFITGETGTGKELCAQAIHHGSGRPGPFMALNCGAIPENLLESELFGHVKGAFTGAMADRVGAALAAHGGTLFLDEVCEMPLLLQVKLLRFLQTGAVQRLGTNGPEKVDVRVVCATNRDPQAEVRAGRFREDLYYRLAVVPIHMPALRERGDDIIELANFFLAHFMTQEGKTGCHLAASDQEKMLAYPWPGNIRELRNVIQRAVIMADQPQLKLDLPIDSHSATGNTIFYSSDERDSWQLVASETDNLERFESLRLKDVGRLVIEEAMKRSGGNVPAAAKLLNVSPSTLYRQRSRRQSIFDRKML